MLWAIAKKLTFMYGGFCVYRYVYCFERLTNRWQGLQVKCVCKIKCAVGFIVFLTYTFSFIYPKVMPIPQNMLLIAVFHLKWLCKIFKVLLLKDQKIKRFLFVFSTFSIYHHIFVVNLFYADTYVDRTYSKVYLAVIIYESFLPYTARQIVM